MKNIASIKSFKYATPFKLMTSTEFNEKRNEQPGLTGIPEIGAIVDNKLLVYPVPTAEEDGETIEFIVSLKSGTVTISKIVEPELPEAYDLCLEYFATSQFLSGKERAQWYADYLLELRRVRGLEHRKFHTIARKPIEGFL